ncbi:MAG TPA: ZPR1 zinc finger domain-containing protein [Desulfurococcaceae archaeon]|nr:ZPR1 zinc finger domain-containing protein [Desulfurococcaceae archaeon]
MNTEVRILSLNTDEIIKDTKYVPKKLSEQIVKCPVCGTNTVLETYSHSIPIEGVVLIFVMICRNCGYKYRDMIPLSHANRPIRIKIHVEVPEDLNTLIYRSPYAHISIPELELEISPGPANPGEITTIDGLLMHIAENLFPLCDTTEDPSKCYNIVQKLLSVINGDSRIYIELVDPSGFSTVIRSPRRKNFEIEYIE